MATDRTPMIEVRNLRLDSSNPRLPEHLHGAKQTELLTYLYENAALDEIATSFVDNGFFVHEPLIVSLADGDGVHDVLEGNRRLAALTVLFRLEAAEALDIAFSIDPAPTREQLERLRRVPCVVVEKKEDVRRFLGFRHIGGIKTWSAEAKARYLLEEVRLAHDQDPNKNPFTVVGRVVGNNALGVRNPYIALRILVHGRETFGIDITAIQRHRFGVWNRAMNSPDLRAYIGFGDARTFHEIERALGDLKEDQLREVLKDMTPQGGRRQAVLSDSRDVTIYALVLQNDTAHQVLREYDDLSLARQIVEQASVPRRIRQTGQSIDILIREISRHGASQEALQPAIELFRLAQTLHDLIDARVRAQS